MDCNRFDEFLDELRRPDRSPHAQELLEAQEHAKTCKRCATALDELAPELLRDVQSLPPPPSSSSDAGDNSHVSSTDNRQNSRWLSWLAWAGARAMRPQVATGALLLLLLVSSLLLLGGRLGGHTDDIRSVTENGVPETPTSSSSTQILKYEKGRLPPLDKHLVRGSTSPNVRDNHHGTNNRFPKAAASHSDFSAGTSSSARSPRPPSQANANPAQLEAFDAARSLYDAGNYVAARSAFDKLALQGGSLAPRASLYSAMSVRASSGCDKALPFLEVVVARFGSSSAGKQAKWETAVCARVLGDYIRARILLRELASDPNYTKRATAELRKVSRLGPQRHHLDSH